MRDRTLLVRMAVVSAILFAFYAALVQVGLSMGLGLPAVVGGLVLFVAIQYVIGTTGVLRQVNAVDLPEDDFRAFHEEFEAAADELGFEEPPRLMVAPLGVPNAFAIGRKNKGAVVVSPTLLDLLDFDEAAGVAAHELAHLKNRDSILMVIGESLSTIVAITVVVLLSVSDNFLTDLMALAIGFLVKFVVMLFVLALSRYREYAADRDAALAMGDGAPLANALRKLEDHQGEPAVDAASNVNALCITPFEDGVLASLLSTHPATDKRVARLEEL